MFWGLTDFVYARGRWWLVEFLKLLQVPEQLGWFVCYFSFDFKSFKMATTQSL